MIHSSETYLPTEVKEERNFVNEANVGGEEDLGGADP